MQPQHPLTRSFRDRALESEYRAQLAAESRFRFRLSALIASALWLGVTILDPHMGGSPENTDVVRMLRFATVPPIAMLTLVGWMSPARFERYWQLALGTACALVISTIVAMAALVDVRFNFAIAVVGVVLTIVCAYTIPPLRFVHALAACVPPSIAFAIVGTRFPGAGANAVWIAFANVGGAAAAFLIENASRRVFLYGRMLAAERARSDALLANLLPAAIAERLREGPSTIAESVPSATVLFADIVGFTPLSERIEAVDLVRELDAIFSRFDELAEHYGLEKIKTIGDAYMCVAGVPNATEDHACAAADMALAMRDHIAQQSEIGGAQLAIRIGIHTGPVVAGVIGKKRLVYDLWGDTVNTASRMESHGIPGGIQITEAMRDALGDRYELELRGPLAIKGKGEMTTWLLIAKRT